MSRVSPNTTSPHAQTVRRRESEMNAPRQPDIANETLKFGPAPRSNYWSPTGTHGHTRPSRPPDALAHDHRVDSQRRGTQRQLARDHDSRGRQKGRVLFCPCAEFHGDNLWPASAVRGDVHLHTRAELTTAGHRDLSFVQICVSNTDTHWLTATHSGRAALPGI